MPKSRTFGLFAALSVGLVLRMIATGLEAMGDKAPLAAEGVSGERLVFHGAALLLTMGALVCFGWALMGLFRKRQKMSAELEQVFAEDVPVWAKAEGEAASAPAPLPPMLHREQPKGFGRKLT